MGECVNVCVCVCRVGKRVRVRHELHPQCGHQRASGGRGGSQAGGDKHLPPKG